MVVNVESSFWERLDGKGIELNVIGKEFLDFVVSVLLVIG